jgi:hypothetical protein
MTQWGLDVLFNPAKRHMDDEKQRLQSTREEVGDASKGKRIDLGSGTVVIRRKTNADEPTDEAQAEADEAATDEAEAETEATAKAEGDAETDADG